jgi:hypothetical protein
MIRRDVLINEKGEKGEVQFARVKKNSMKR